MLLKSKSIAAATVLSLTLGAAVPAHAWGRSEQNTLKVIAAALVVGALIHQGQKSKAPKPQPTPKPVYRQPAVQPPVYQQPSHQDRRDQAASNANRYDQAPIKSYDAPVYQQPQQKTGRVIGQTSAYGSGVNDTTAAQVFNSYSPYQRVAIQRKLAEFGYYNGTLDGAFGPRTHQALYEFARVAGKQDALGNARGASQVYNALLG
ncbi:peptidoglycan-binding protein [Pseudorhodobacter sp. W20_MBD10_FR17]|uniref:peptidoglycan-binding domain-containing protein n=1 Tax=Pseudorhodobacter sp. W20_MBD10_FR17 TaxID=3240266 RepID=UPI003F9863C2